MIELEFSGVDETTFGRLLVIWSMYIPTGATRSPRKICVDPRVRNLTDDFSLFLIIWSVLYPFFCFYSQFRQNDKAVIPYYSKNQH